MNELQKVFDYEGAQVRTVMVNDEIIFNAKDICDVLEVTWSGSKTLDKISDKHKGLVNFTTPGGSQEMWGIDESGVYKLVMRSNKEEAERFQDWIVDDVLPSIRKTGTYTTEPLPAMTQTQIIAAIAQHAAEQEQAFKQLQQEQGEQKATLTLLTTRVNTLDKVEVEGDEQQQLNKMVQKYAHESGVTYSKAWNDFKTAYNMAYHTNLTRLIDIYKDKHGLKTLTTPQYLSLTGKLLDALRVADKMLNTAKAI